MQFFGARLAGVMLIGAALLIPSYMMLSLQERELQRELEGEERALPALGVHDKLTASRHLEVALADARAYLNAPATISPTLDYFFREASMIAVQSLAIKKDGAITLSGYARTRADLLGFEKLLRDSGRFSDVAFPLSSIVQDHDIHFSMQTQLKSAVLSAQK